MSEANPKIVDFTNQDISKQDGLYLLDFWAAWCGPCVQMNPVLNRLIAEETDPKVSNLKIGKINVDDDPKTAQSYGVRTIPAFFLIDVKGGEVKILNKFVGSMSYDSLKNQVIGSL